MSVPPNILYWKRKIKKLTGNSKINILEIECGKGEFGRMLGKYIAKRYYGIDPSEEKIKYAIESTLKEKNVHYLLGSAEEIPLENKFEVLFYTFSWHFIKDFKKAITEADRILTKNGAIIIIEPNDKTKNWGGSKLTKKDSDFSKKMYNRKMKMIENGRKAIKKQRKFSIIEENRVDGSHPSLWVLKRKSE